jgi:hypothetical protein
MHNTTNRERVEGRVGGGINSDIPYPIVQYGRQCCGSGSALILVMRMRIQVSKNDPQKEGKKTVFEILDVLF